MPVNKEFKRAGDKKADGSYADYKETTAFDESEVVSQIKSANQLSKSELTVDDMLYSMSRTKSGRLAMRSYRDSSDVFITNGGTNPIYVNSYYLKVNGIGDISSAKTNGGYLIDEDVTAKSADIRANMTAAATLSLRTRRTLKIM